MKEAANLDRIAQLAQEVMHHKRLYYAGRPEVADAVYDRLEDELRRLSPEHPVLAFVGTEPDSTSKKVSHTTPMLSLGKTYLTSELESWMKDHSVLGTIKVDGNSLSLIYCDKTLELAKTRGNGRVGEDVTDKARWVSDVNPRLTSAEEFEVRGELYCTSSQFALLSKEMVAAGLEKPTSPRNIVAGLLGRKTQYSLASYFNFMAFDVIFPGEEHNFNTEVEKFAWLQASGFRLPEPELLKEFTDVDVYLNKVKRMMDADEIGLDGAVFTFNDTALHAEMGSTSHHPRYKLSFKWQGETATSTIESLRWETSRRGMVTPVAVVEPVFLSGAQITNITLHNASHVMTHNIKPGDRIEIVRSGEVIPKFLQVVQPGKGQYQFPDSCPSCGGKLTFDDVRLNCGNKNKCPAQQSLGILNWIKCVEIDDLSEKRLGVMLEMGLVQEIPDLYRLTVEDLLSMPMTKEKMARKLYDNIQKSKSVPAARFLFGLGIEGAGLTSWEKLLGEIGDLSKLRVASAETIAAVDGFAERSAEQIVKGLEEKAVVMDALLTTGVKPLQQASAIQRDGPLSGKQIVITGALSMPRGELAKRIKACGGVVGSAVSGNTHAVVTNDPGSMSSKMKKARALGIEIWSEADLLQLIETP